MLEFLSQAKARRQQFSQAVGIKGSIYHLELVIIGEILLQYLRYGTIVP